LIDKTLKPEKRIIRNGKKMILIIKLLCLFKKLIYIIFYFFFDKAVEKNSIRKICLSKNLIKQRMQVDNNNEI